MAVASPDSRLKYIHTQIKDFVHTSYKTQSFALRGKGSENVVRIYETRADWRIQGRGPGPLLFLDQTESRRRAEKKFGETASRFLCKGLDDQRPPTPYLKLWIRHWEQTDSALQNKRRLQNAKAVFTL